MSSEHLKIQSSNQGVTQELTPEIVKKIAENDPLAILGSPNRVPDSNNDHFGQINNQLAPRYKRLLARIIDSTVYLVVFLFMVTIGSTVLYFKYGSNPDRYSKLLYCSSSNLSADQLAKLDVGNACDVFAKDFNLLSTIIYVGASLCSIAYFVVTTKMDKATVGKRIMKIKVASENEQNLTWIQSLGREFFWILFALTILMSIFSTEISSNLSTVIFSLLILDGINIYFNNSNKTLHDRISQTQVTNAIKGH